MTGLVESEDLREKQISDLGRDFRLYATGRAVSVVGDRIALIALVFVVIDQSRSFAPALAVFYACNVAPTLFGGLLVGALVDRVNRQKYMVMCDVGRALVLCAVPATAALNLWTLYPMVIALYTLTLVFDSAASASVPDVVPASALTKANAILTTIDRTADFAYVVGGSLVYFLKLQVPFFIDAATFLFSAAMIASMKIPYQSRDNAAGAGVIVRIREGISFLLRQPFLRTSLFTWVSAAFAGGVIFVLTPLYANRSLGESAGLVGPLQGGAFRFSVLEVAVGIGALAGSLIAVRVAQRWPRARIFGASVAALGVLTASVAATENLYVAVILLAGAGLFNSLYVIAGATLWQAMTPSEMRGRVIAARLTVINAALAFGSLIGGLILISVPYAVMWLCCGALVAASSLFVLLRSGARDQD